MAGFAEGELWVGEGECVCVCVCPYAADHRMNLDPHSEYGTKKKKKNMLCCAPKHNKNKRTYSLYE